MSRIEAIGNNNRDVIIYVKHEGKSIPVRMSLQVARQVFLDFASAINAVSRANGELS